MLLCHPRHGRKHYIYLCALLLVCSVGALEESASLATGTVRILDLAGYSRGPEAFAARVPPPRSWRRKLAMKAAGASPGSSAASKRPAVEMKNLGDSDAWAGSSSDGSHPPESPGSASVQPNPNFGKKLPPAPFSQYPLAVGDSRETERRKWFCERCKAQWNGDPRCPLCMYDHRLYRENGVTPHMERKKSSSKTSKASLRRESGGSSDSGGAPSRRSSDESIRRTSSVTSDGYKKVDAGKDPMPEAEVQTGILGTIRRGASSMYQSAKKSATNMKKSATNMYYDDRSF